jgi:hypothetical protein
MKGRIFAIYPVFIDHSQKIHQQEEPTGGFFSVPFKPPQ